MSTLAIWIRLLASVLALTCGLVACVIVIQLLSHAV
jgi:hypothetical protein